MYDQSPTYDDGIELWFVGAGFRPVDSVVIKGQYVRGKLGEANSAAGFGLPTSYESNVFRLGVSVLF